jgi:hypothetical protein
MEKAKLVGPQAGSLKYDILTALTVFGLHGSPTLQTSMTRLCAIVTARYNWRLDEITIGQPELARVWGVNERTVKREMKRLTTAGILMCLRPGVRGRVGAYRLNYSQIYRLTRPTWAVVGSDFENRMVEISGERTVVQVDFKPKPAAINLTVEETGTWGSVRQRLKIQDKATFESWFAKLVQDHLDDENLVLRAPNNFVARYIEAHFAKQLADAVAIDLPTKSKIPRRITLISDA